jgi:hypothetical protein
VLVSANVSVPPVADEGFTTLVIPAPYDSLLPVTGSVLLLLEPELPLAHAARASPIRTAHAAATRFLRLVMSRVSPRPDGS